jgi:O-antigen ligase
MLFISALAVSGLYLTFSRGAGLGLYLAVLFLCMVRKKWIILFILVAVLIIYPFIMPQNIKDWTREIHYRPVVFIWDYARLSMHRNAFNMIKHHPLIGVGVNTFSKNYGKYKLSEPDYGKTQDTVYAHNIFLQMAGEIGLLGLGAFFWMLFNFFKNGARLYKNLKDEYYKTISISLVACIIAFLINGLTETSLYYSRVAMIFWYLIGFTLALNKYLYADNP